MSEATLPPIPRHLKLLGLTTFALFAVLVAINIPLITYAAPQGVISLQFAVTAEQTIQILHSWGAGNSYWAEASLLLDLPFIAVYVSTLLALTGYLLLDRPGIRERQAGRWVRGLFVAAGASDVGENICLLSNLTEPTDTLSLTASLFALVKFTALLLGTAGLLIIRASRRHSLHT